MRSARPASRARCIHASRSAPAPTTSRSTSHAGSARDRARHRRGRRNPCDDRRARRRRRRRGGSPMPSASRAAARSSSVRDAESPGVDAVIDDAQARRIDRVEAFDVRRGPLAVADDDGGVPPARRVPAPGSTGVRASTRSGVRADPARLRRVRRVQIVDPCRRPERALPPLTSTHAARRRAPVHDARSRARAAARRTCARRAGAAPRERSRRAAARDRAGDAMRDEMDVAAAARQISREPVIGAVHPAKRREVAGRHEPRPHAPSAP